MASRYRVEIAPRAERDLRKIKDRDGLRRIARAIDSLRENPRPEGSRKLAGTGRGDFWRLRVGSYRIIYAIEGRRLLVIVVKVGDRKAVYSDLSRLRSHLDAFLRFLSERDPTRGKDQ